MMADMQQEIRWEIGVPIFRTSVIVKQLGLAIGIPFGLVTLYLVIMSGRSRETLYALGSIGALFLLTWLLIMAVHRGRYEAEFVLDQKGAVCRTQARQAKKNRIINALAVLLGLLSGKPAAAGAGLLAQSRQEVFLPWSRITEVKCKPRKLVVLLRCGWTERLVLFCTQDNYEQVKNFVLQKMGRPDAAVRN